MVQERVAEMEMDSTRVTRRLDEQASQPGAHIRRQRVAGIEAEHCDEVRPDYLSILRELDVDDPQQATTPELIAAGIFRALHGLRKYQVGRLVPRAQARGRRIKARLDHV